MIEWTGKNRFQVGDTRFKCLGLGLGDPVSTLDEFVFQKPEWMVRRYEKLIQGLQPKQIFELGIWRGGSCVFFHELCNASKLVTVDLSEDRIAAVDQYIEKFSLQESLVPLYGVNQADIPLLRGIASDHFTSPGIDLVIDDASHFLDESRASFNALFPLVRPGGAYVIEDWPWAHGAADLPDDTEGFYPDKVPLTKLIFEIVLACPSTDGYISKIEIDENSATIWRGAAEIPPEDFAVERCCLKRGRELIAN